MLLLGLDESLHVLIMSGTTRFDIAKIRKSHIFADAPGMISDPQNRKIDNVLLYMR